VAETIAGAIEKHSERGPDTKFIDADGGLCLVTGEVMRKRLFPGSGITHFVFEKENNCKVHSIFLQIEKI
jgi:hypothetical protein